MVLWALLSVAASSGQNVSNAPRRLAHSRVAITKHAATLIKDRYAEFADGEASPPDAQPLGAGREIHGVGVPRAHVRRGDGTALSDTECARTSRGSCSSSAPRAAVAILSALVDNGGSGAQRSYDAESKAPAVLGALRLEAGAETRLSRAGTSP